MGPSPPTARTGPWIPLALVVSLAGCGDELGPVPFATAKVGGIVLEAGRPVPGGFIEFSPTGGTIGVIRSAPIGKDGRFVADRVAVGPNAIRVIGAPVRRDLRPLLQSNRIAIEREVSGGSRNAFSIDLMEEAFRSRAADQSG